MSFFRSASALRTTARGSFSKRLLTARRNMATQTTHTTGGGSDMPWIVGSVGLTIPAAYYLLASSKSGATHHKPHHESLEHPKEAAEDLTPTTDDAQREAAKAKHSVVEGAKETASNVKENTANLKEKASNVTSDDAKETAKDAASSVKETASNAADKLKPTMPKKPDVGDPRTGVNPQDVDPGKSNKGQAGNTNVMSGKQEGLSNEDTDHKVLHSERGEYISKKAEGVHDSTKIKGTVDVDRPGK